MIKFTYLSVLKKKEKCCLIKFTTVRCACDSDPSDWYIPKPSKQKAN